MRQVLKIGQRIYLNESSNNHNKSYEYVIHDITGFGASCIVYEVYYKDSLDIKHLVRLKEFYPVRMNIIRDKNSNLILDKKYIKKFEYEKELFFKAYKKNVMFQTNLEILNTTGNVQNLLYGNNTAYIVVNYNNGTSYDKVKNESLHDILQVGLSLAKTIKKYHEYGYLHLDIKPENILKLPETNEIIILFDYGSVESIENIHLGKLKSIAYSESWAAPELVQCKFKKICEATDIYSIGAVLFYKIMGRIPTIDDRNLFADWEFDLNDVKFEGCNPKIFRYIKELFNNTLKSTILKRYKTTNELIKILEKLVDLSTPNSIYIKSNFARNDNIFIGRQNEIELIYDKLKNETDAVFLHGFGGIGKSVLAKQYAFLYREDYDVIIFANYFTNLFDLVLNDRDIPIANFKRIENEDENSYFKRKMDKICDLADGKTLIIIDNFDVDEDDNLEELINCGCKFIITTRNDFTDYNYHQIEIEAFKDINDLRNLFYSYNTMEYSKAEKTIIDEIIEIVDRHTMTVELIAKQLRMTKIEPDVLYQRLKSIEGITNEDKEKIKLRKDSKLNNKSIMAHLEIVFDMAKLDKFEEYILMNMSLIGNVKINKNEFIKWCEIEEIMKLNVLIDRGWIEFKEEKISLHQIIIDLIYNKLKPTSETCESLTKTMSDMTKMRIKNNSIKRNQYISLIYIFAKRIKGRNLSLAEFYNDFANLLSSRNKSNCLDYHQKSIKIYNYLNSENKDFNANTIGNYKIKEGLLVSNFNIGKSFIMLLSYNQMEFIDENKTEDYINKLKNSFDICIKIQQDISGEKSLEVADKYIEIAEIFFNSFDKIYISLDQKQAMEYLSYFEKCLLNIFQIKSDILGMNNQQTKDCCYELYEYYLANSDNLIMFKNLIQDKKKGLYYGELYMGE